MEESFQLRATMSPKHLNTKVKIKKPTKLCLRKNIRRSSIYGRPPPALADIGTRHVEDSSSEIEFESAESNFDESCAMFADLSIIPKEGAMTAMNSTFIEGRRTQFHEMFQSGNKKKKPQQDNPPAIKSKNDDISPTHETIEGAKIIEKSTDVTNNISKEIFTPSPSEEVQSEDRNYNLIVSKTGKLEEIPKVLEETYGNRRNEDEVLRTEPRKKLSTRINEIHEAVCLTDGKKLNWQEGGDFDNSKKLFPTTPHVRKNAPIHKTRKLYKSDSENESWDFTPKEFKESSLTQNKKNKSKLEINKSKSRTHRNCSSHSSNLTETKRSEALNGNNSSETSDSEDEILSKKNFKRIVKRKDFKVTPLKKKNIKENSREVKNSNSRMTETNKSKECREVKNSNSRMTETNKSKELTGCNSEIVVISESEDDEVVRKEKSEEILFKKPDNIMQKTNSAKSEEFKAENNGNIDENDNLEEIRKVLDEVYGSNWREREHEVMRTEPRKKVSTKTDKTHNPLNKTDVKGVKSNKENIPNNANINLINSGSSANVYTDSPAQKFSTSLKPLERRKLFPSVDTDDTDSGENPRKPTSKTIHNLAKLLAVKSSTNKTSVQNTPKYSWVKDRCSDSEAESVEVVVSSESDADWESPQDHLPKIMTPNLAKYSVQKKQRTFLESLSKNVPILDAHPTARIFRGDFKKHRDELTSRLFEQFNKDVFGGVIPADTVINWNPRLRGTAGYCKTKSKTHRDKTVTRTVSLSLSNKILDSPDRLRDTLIHEMCHAANWIADGQAGHGPSWRNWTVKARNVFPELPPMNVCHSYNIATKYTYRCQGCGYSFGRHSKSIKIEQKCCGYCKGKLELLVNKVSKSGSTSSTPAPATPKRNPSGFALFVKDNYKTFRTPDRKHGDVMRLLSQQFSSLKVQRTNSMDN